MRACRFGLIVIFSLTLGLTSSAPFAADSKTEPPAPAPKTLADLQKAIQASLTKNRVPGVGIALVARDHLIWAGGVGEADMAAHKLVTADTVFRVGSVSKGFVALALLKLQEEGKIDLNAPVKTIAPEIEIHNPWEATDPVRVVNLLEHTAGFDDMHFNEVYNTAGSPDISLREVFARFTKPQYVRWRPGTRMSYSNPGYGLAGYLIEKVTGQRFEDYIQGNILNPLGMTHSSFRLTDAVRERLSAGYDGNPPKAVPYLNIYLRPAGNLLSSPAEMALWVRMMLNRGMLDGKQIVRQESISRMEAPTTTLAARAGLRAGYGLGNTFGLEHAFVEHGHDGGIAGFISRYCYMPDQGLGYVILLDSSSPGKALEETDNLLFDYLTAGLATSPQPAIQIPTDQLMQFTGYYQAENPRNQILGFLGQFFGVDHVYLDHGVLHEKGLVGGKPDDLVPVSNNQFRLKKEPVASRIFFRADDGARLLGVSNGLYAERLSPAWPVLRWVLLFSALLLMASSPLFALIWIPRKLLRRMKEVKHLGVRILPLLAVVSLIVAVVAFIKAMSATNLGLRSPSSLTFCALTWLFAIFSIWGLVAGLRSYSLEMKPVVRLHSLLVALACCGVTAYLAYWHIIGLRLWAW
jgi:CubicO group peptidase (beta-lactamase class C family)